MESETTPSFSQQQQASQNHFQGSSTSSFVLEQVKDNTHKLLPSSIIDPPLVYNPAVQEQYRQHPPSSSSPSS
ncbi:hypothetical protein BGZ99_000382, partial [Dissophora globulifera]